MNNSEIYTQRRKEAQEQHIKFQPVIMVLRNQRLECSCGALATFVNAELDEDGSMMTVCVECHDCYCREDEEE